eukprot:857777-Lingulodinium_polyedra.AAC.1
MNGSRFLGGSFLTTMLLLFIGSTSILQQSPFALDSHSTTHAVLCHSRSTIGHCPTTAVVQ